MITRGIPPTSHGFERVNSQWTDSCYMPPSPNCTRRRQLEPPPCLRLSRNAPGGSALEKIEVDHYPFTIPFKTVVKCGFNVWLVVWNMNFIFPYIGNVILPFDFHIFQTDSSTNQIWFPMVSIFFFCSLRRSHVISHRIHVCYIW